MRGKVRAKTGALAAGIALLIAAPAGCGTGLDTARATTCRRALPALVPPDATVEILRIGGGPAADSVRVDYRLTGRPEAAAKARWIVCGFRPGEGLASVDTESGPVSGASVYLLRRYYLDTPEAAAADPGRR